MLDGLDAKSATLKQVLEDLHFVLTVAASRPVRVDPVPENNLVEPGGQGGGGDSEEDRCVAHATNPKP